MRIEWNAANSKSDREEEVRQQRSVVEDGFSFAFRWTFALVVMDSRGIEHICPLFPRKLAYTTTGDEGRLAASRQYCFRGEHGGWWWREQRCLVAVPSSSDGYGKDTPVLHTSMASPFVLRGGEGAMGEQS